DRRQAGAAEASCRWVKPRRPSPIQLSKSQDDKKCSRGAFRPRFCKFLCPHPQTRGRRECRVHAAPAVSCAKLCIIGAHEHTGQRKHSDIPCAMALRLTSCSPRWSGLVVTVAGGTLPANLAPASRRQDHTTSPYAWRFRPALKTPDAKASITSRAPRFVTIMIRPSCGRETGAV